ncbi:MAG: hypothetical protein ACLPX5_09530 [Dissulfurispiraceae bacterium]
MTPAKAIKVECYHCMNGRKDKCIREACSLTTVISQWSDSAGIFEKGIMPALARNQDEIKKVMARFGSLVGPEISRAIQPPNIIYEAKIFITYCNLLTFWLKSAPKE